MAVRALHAMTSCFTGNLKSKRQCRNYCSSEESIIDLGQEPWAPVSGYKIMVCDDELEWVGRWPLWWIKWHLHHVKFETGMSDRSLCLKTTPICQNFQLRNKEKKCRSSLFREQYMYVRNAAINFTQSMQLFFALILNRLE